MMSLLDTPNVNSGQAPTGTATPLPPTLLPQQHELGYVTGETTGRDERQMTRGVRRPKTEKKKKLSYSTSK